MGRNNNVIDEFRAARDAIQKWKLDTFRHGQIVFVDCGRYTGQGEAWHPDNRDCPADELPVLLTNGNVWCYPLDSIRTLEVIE